MISLSLDFETYSEVDLKKVGAWVYSEHPSTEVVCMAYSMDRVRPRLWTPGNLYPEFLLDSTAFHFSAWSSFFEYCIIRNTLKLKPAPIPQWTDTMVLAANLSLPLTLGTCAKAVGLPEDKQKLKEGRDLINKLSKPQKKKFRSMDSLQQFCKTYANKHGVRYLKTDLKKMIVWYRNFDPDLLEKFYWYCKQDVITEMAVGERCGELHPHERELWELDQNINIRGCQFDVPSIKNAIIMRNERVDELHTELSDLTGLECEAATEVQKLKQYISKETGYKLKSFDKALLVETLKDPKLPPKAKRIIEIRQQAGKSSLAKFDSMLNTTAKDGRVHGLLQFLAATTGRWGGRLVQPHNFPRPLFPDTDECIKLFDSLDLDLIETFYDEPMDALLSCLRGMLCAGKGKQLYVCDFTAIEAVFLSWLADETYRLEIFRGHGLIYETAASKIFKVPLEEVTKDQRFNGKISELSCGFQGSFKALLQMARMYGVELDKIFAASIVKEWRASNPRIVAFWGNLNECATKALQNPGKVYSLKWTHGVLKFVSHKDFLYILLPSGRKLAYPRAHLKWGTIAYEDEYGETKTFESLQIRFMGLNENRQWTRQSTYGGKLCENVTSAIARDLLAAAMLRVEKAGYPVILTVHDEIISETDKGFGSLEEFEKLMCTLPSWAEGLPVKADGFVSTRWRKN
ncbi:XRE family transcriptional regulator [Candidatus Pacearchaeota archaeon]|nr:XRE family transcriptional regulator [Candidatus Pacearchaeota archaeon]